MMHIFDLMIMSAYRMLAHLQVHIVCRHTSCFQPSAIDAKQLTANQFFCLRLSQALMAASPEALSINEKLEVAQGHRSLLSSQLIDINKQIDDIKARIAYHENKANEHAEQLAYHRSEHDIQLALLDALEEQPIAQDRASCARG